MDTLINKNEKMMERYFKICRICLESEENLISIFENNDIASDIFYLTGFQVIEFSKNIPAQICSKCVTDLAIATKFKQRCKKSEDFFKKLSSEIELTEWNSRLKDLYVGSSKCIETDDFPFTHSSVEHIKTEPSIIEDSIIGYSIDSGSERGDNQNFDYEDLHSYKERKIYKCSVSGCGTILSSKKTLSYHMKVKHKQNVTEQFPCEYCGKTFVFKYALSRHVREAHTKPVISYCEHCPRSFSSDQGLKYHMKSIHKEKASTQFFCDICQKCFPIKSKITRHIRETHLKLLPNKSKREQHSDPLPCPICGKLFKTRAHLTQHEKIHRVLTPNDYFYCDLCGNKFKEKPCLTSHIKKRHILKIRFHCQICTNRSFSTNFQLKRHVRVDHYKIRDFKCEWCGKEFGTKDKMECHVRIHTGEHKYQCEFCERKFIHQTDYRRHVWTHTGESKYRCRFCPKVYSKRSELTSHRNLHHPNM